MVTTIDHIDDVLRRPPDEALAALRDAGLLPANPIDERWTPSRNAVRPAATPLLQVDPSRPYVPGKARTLVLNAASSFAGILGEVFVRLAPSTPGIIYLYLSELGPNRACVAWLDVRVAHPPTSTLKIGATGNPSTLLVTHQASGGQRMQVPFAFTATASGESTLYLVPTVPTGSGAYWHAASIYGL